jgi:DNA-binding MarR family transcriptional regulator
MYDPEPSPEADILAAINEVPQAFFRLAAIADEILGDLGVTAPERNAMRHLFVEGEATAPDLARRKPVTRQSMQAILDGLVAKGIAGAQHNPRHKRSKLYALTPRGVALCVEIQKRELSAIRELMAGVDSADFAAAATALRAMNARLEARLSQSR